MKFIIVILTIALQGCAAIAIEDVRQLHDAAIAGVKERHDARRKIRDKCEEILNSCVSDFRESGDDASAARTLADAYPPLITIEIAKELIEKDGINAFSKSKICLAVVAHCPNQNGPPDTE